MHASNVSRTLAILSCLVLSCTAHAEQNAEDPAPSEREISFHTDVEPILSRHCYGCHQGAKQLGSYLMTDFTALLSGGESEQTAVIPGKPDESYLVEQITPVDGHAEMPDEPFEPLSDAEVETIRNWISQGAKNDSSAPTARYTSENVPQYVGSPPLPSIDISPDGTKVAVAGFYEVIVIDSDSGQTTTRLVGMSPRLNTVRFSPDGKRLAAVGGTPAVRGELQIWDLESNELALSRSVTYDTLSGASWSPDGSKLAFGATDNVVRAIETETGEQVLFQGAHDDWVRDTAFTPDGKHVISVARDMSCKLTEVETERFIDNITSITPGALSGGLSSVRSHPTRNEILVGGADGIAKVYRVFRETARKIGDDANLVRKLPKLPGRIFCVAISPDASRLAAAATLDGKSEIRVWKYDFTSELTPELKAILAKRVAERNAEEKKQVDAYQNSEIKELAKLSIDDAAAYAIDFAPDNSLVVAASDGKIRRVDPAGNIASVHAAVELNNDESIAAAGFDARRWNETVVQGQTSDAGEDIFDSAKVTTLSVEPAELTFRSPYGYAQLIVTAKLADDSSVDVTRLCEVELPNWATIEPSGLVRPASDGNGALQIAFGGQSVTVKASASGISAADDTASDHGAVDYIQDVAPILSRLGCNQGTCHGAQKGKNGFKLSLRGYDPTYDLRALTDDLAARRINPSSPDESLMLRKPLGLSPHQGGVLMSPGDPNHTVLRRWIEDGSHVEMTSPRVTRIEVFPINPIVQRTDALQQVRVVAHFGDGTKRDVTREAFIESGNTEVATANRTGLLSALRRGEAPILARYEGAYAATTLTVMGDRREYKSADAATWSRVDELVAQKWARVKVTPSELCDDATFLRRVYLDLTGLPPTSSQVRDFLADQTPTRMKRAKIVDELIGSEAYIDFWTNKWADLLQVNRKFLGVEGSTKFRDWIRTAVAENRPYDEFAHQILTASGSNNENPPASYFKVLRTPEDTMENTTHLFLGIRFNCNKCHDHPFERWTQDQYYQMSAYFAQVGLENDPASGNRKVAGTAVEGAKPLFEKVVDKKKGDISHPRTNQVVPPVFPFEVPHDAKSNGTRREQLAAWITDPDNPYFARSYVNRLWGYLFGVGLIEPIDDIRAGNPATNPDLLSHLTQAFVDSEFDVAQMHRMICNSRTYQLSVKTNPLNEDDSLNYSHAIPRRLPAEVIYDAVHSLTGAVSSIPGMPAGTRAAALTDSGVKLADGFLQNLGRPARESACECERNSDLQLGPVMALISGPTIGTAIADPKNELERIVAEHSDDNALAEEIFLRALARRPTESELAAFTDMKQIIQESHRDLVTELESVEETWKGRRVELEKQREIRLAAIIQKIEARTEEIKPERERLAKEREDRIKAAEAIVAEAKKKVEAKIDKWTSEEKKGVEWFPLAATSASSTNKAVLTPQSDRSILASGNKAKTVYTVTAKTSLNHITGLRLEALTDDSLPTKGPGSAPNGNFVLTELEVTAAPSASPKDAAAVKISSGVADFLQDGFNIAQTFDGRTRDQKGWAVAGATGKEHWATYKFEKPVSVDGGVVLTLKMHQFHNAAEHTLGRFRFSVTTRDGDIPLGASESFAAALSTPKANRSDATKTLLSDHIATTDDEIRKANAGLAVARAAVPPDAKLVTLEKRKEALSKPTPDDPALVQMREDTKQSTLQLQKLRLTAAEDLTWALINSPAFLFNH